MSIPLFGARWIGMQVRFQNNIAGIRRHICQNCIVDCCSMQISGENSLSSEIIIRTNRPLLLGTSSTLTKGSGQFKLSLAKQRLCTAELTIDIVPSLRLARDETLPTVFSFEIYCV